MSYAPYVEKERQIQETRAKYEEALQPFNRTAPRPFPEETHEEYRRRALPIFEAARREADKPTMIPEGELREIKRFDQSGRVSLEFHGKPSVWLSQVAPDRRRLMGIRTETERGYHLSNISSNLVGTKY
jgi:hypothetical protein